jgi:hypothetical protein
VPPGAGTSIRGTAQRGSEPDRPRCHPARQEIKRGPLAMAGSENQILPVG